MEGLRYHWPQAGLVTPDWRLRGRGLCLVPVMKVWGSLEQQSSIICISANVFLTFYYEVKLRKLFALLIVYLLINIYYILLQHFPYFVAYYKYLVVVGISNKRQNGIQPTSDLTDSKPGITFSFTLLCLYQFVTLRLRILRLSEL